MSSPLSGQAHWNRPPWPGTIVTICMSCFMTGGSGKEHRTNKTPLTGRVRERSKGDTTCLTISQNPSHWHPCWRNKACPTRKDSESVCGRAVLLGLLTLLLSTRVPFPNKISCFVSTCVSSDNSFPSVRQEPSFGPWKGSPFLYHNY